jgi:hypothetical protein
VRAERRLRPRPGDHRPVIPGLSAPALAEVARAELTRNYLWPGVTTVAVRRWRAFVRSRPRRLWDGDTGCGEWECCGSPWEAREFLEGVIRTMSRRRARELRRLVGELDDLY